MGGAVSTGEDNDELIDNLVEAEYIKTPLIERIFRAVDRAHYYTDGLKKNAYKDLAWKHGNLHLSAPCIYSEVMESLKLEPRLSFLNLGSGTGYLSTMVGLVIGPYGINHGVELHEDVVEYAFTKLKEFKQSSFALDEYEFCEPQFVVGNCLQLHGIVRQYDRVYCGASCPKEHENYMKNLIKVGGILLMPLGDQLLQVTRSTQTTWETKTILPVSFASLVLPAKDSEEVVKLPECEPLLLMEACRFNIRIALKKNVETEHPKLKDRKRRNPKRKKNKKRVRRIVIPIFEESEDSGQGAEAADDPDFLAGEGSDEVRVNGYPNAGPQSSLHIMNHISGMLHRVVNRQRLHRRRMDRLSDDGDTLQSSSDDSDDDSDEMDMDSSFETPPIKKENNPKITLNTLLGEGTSGTNEHSTLTENNSASADSTSVQNTKSIVLEESDLKGNGPAPVKIRRGQKKFCKEMPQSQVDDQRKENSDKEMDTSIAETRPDRSENKRPVEEDDDDQFESQELSTSDTTTSNNSAFNRSLRKRQSPIIFKRVACEESPPNCVDKEDEDDVDMEDESYMNLVKEKINCLPLPYALKMYLNHERKL